MKKDSLKVNFAFQIVYQVLMLFVPLVIAPYLTRTLGSDNLGTYAYVHSIAYYFVLFAMLGISKYGQRLIAQTEFGSLSQRKAFWSLYLTHSAFSIIAIIAYVFFILVVVKEDARIFWCDIYYVISALFDITWLFYGLENFRSVVYRNTVVKLVECILIFLLVKSTADLSIYVLICSVSLLLGQVAMIPLLIKYVPPIKVSLAECRSHIKPLFVLTIAVLAVSLYTIFGKTLLGLFADKSDVAFYEYADRLVKIPLTFIAVVGTIMLPRACKLVTENDNKSSFKYYINSIWFTSVISTLTFWMLIVLADKIAIGYLGAEFAPCGKIMKMLSPIVLIVGLGDIVRNQYLIPNKRDKQYTIGISLSAIINIIISILLLLYLPAGWKVLGVVIGTMTAELFGTFYQYYVCKDLVSSKPVLSPICICSLIGAISAVFTALLSKLVPESLGFTFLLAFVGVVIYTLLLILYSLKYNHDLWDLIKSLKK